jgi:hypothetical protein
MIVWVTVSLGVVVGGTALYPKYAARSLEIFKVAKALQRNYPDFHDCVDPCECYSGVTGALVAVELQEMEGSLERFTRRHRVTGYLIDLKALEADARRLFQLRSLVGTIKNDLDVVAPGIVVSGTKYDERPTPREVVGTGGGRSRIICSYSVRLSAAGYILIIIRSNHPIGEIR